MDRSGKFVPAQREAESGAPAQERMGVAPLLCGCCGQAFGAINWRALRADAAAGAAWYLCPACRRMAEDVVERALGHREQTGWDIVAEAAALASGSPARLTG